MSNIKRKSFRSPYRDLDLKLLRLLCDLHPWSMAELCKKVELEPPVLSMVLAGQRPLPTRVAEQFLQQVGMREDGSLESDHGFVFVERAGYETALVELFDQMYPNKAAVVQISPDAGELTEGSEVVPRNACRAFFDGIFAVVLHGMEAPSPIAWPATEKSSIRDFMDIEVLISTITLPTKFDMLKAFLNRNFPFTITWEFVIKAATMRSIEPKDVLRWMTTNYPLKGTPPNPN